MHKELTINLSLTTVRKKFAALYLKQKRYVCEEEHTTPKLKSFPFPFSILKQKDYNALEVCTIHAGRAELEVVAVEVESEEDLSAEGGGLRGQEQHTLLHPV